MVCRMRADRERQTVTIHDRHDFQAFSSLRRTDVRTSALRHREGCVDEALFFVQHATRAKLVGDVGQNPAQNLAMAPSLKPAMHRFVIRITLRQHVPLRARVQNPQRRFKNFPRRNRFTARTSFRNVLFRKMMPDTLPFRIAQPNHPNIYSPSAMSRNFEIGSSWRISGVKTDMTILCFGATSRHWCRGAEN